MLRTTLNQPGKGGEYTLSSYPNCTSLHQGAFAGASTYVVGRNTESERLFVKSQLAEATQWAIDNNAGIENLPNQALCDQAITDLYASA